MKLLNSIVIILFMLLFHQCGNKAETLFSGLDAAETGINFRNLLVEDKSLNVAHYLYFYNGAGVAIGDINNDGLPDVFFTGNMVKNRLYLNKGGFKFENITDESHVAEKQGWCTGASMVDINQDGLLDIYVCRSADDNPEKRKNLLFINNGDLTFSEKAGEYGLADNGYSTQASFFDYDKDGDLDCFVLNHSVSQYSTGVTENPEMRNKKIPEYASRLYRNDNGHFNDVSDQAGIISNVLSFGLGIALSDFNNDGWPDIYISNDFKESDYLYLNNKNGTFTESFAKCMDLSSLNSMGSDAADYNNDGFTDLMTLDMLPEGNYLQKTHAGLDNFDKTNFLISKGFQPQYMRNMLQRNNGDGTFSEIGQLAGVSNTDWSWSALFCDFDGDTNKDLFVSNGFVKDFSDLDFKNFTSAQLINSSKGESRASLEETVAKMPTIKIPNYFFKNNGKGSFDNTTKEWGVYNPAISSGAAYADLDNDGDMDLIINNTNEFASVYKNNSTTLTKNNFIRIKLEGTAKNRNGIGTKIKAFCKGDIYYQEQFPVRGYQSSVDMVLNFGLGKVGIIDSLLVIWPGDNYQVLRNLPVNQTLVVKAGDTKDIYSYPVNPSKTIFTSTDVEKMHHS
ncbi:MAG: CRTAC1 family protein, partial [Bacteroidota bacterium]